MARRRRDTDDLERDDDLIASLAAPVSPAPLLTPGPTFWTQADDVLTAIEDRRTFHPDGFFREARDQTGQRARTRVSHTGPWTPATPQHVFHAPGRSVLVCVRRKQRREVIFAKNKRRKGAGARRRRRNYYSNVRC